MCVGGGVFALRQMFESVCILLWKTSGNGRGEEKRAHWMGWKTGSSSVRNTKGSSLKPKSFIFFEGGGLEESAELIRTRQEHNKSGHEKNQNLTPRASPTHSVFLGFHLWSVFQNGVSLGRRHRRRHRRHLRLSLLSLSVLTGGLFIPKLEEGKK